jgi:hypothetical protein
VSGCSLLQNPLRLIILSGMATKTLLLAAMLGCGCAVGSRAAGPEAVLLWPNGAPGTPPGTTAAEKYEPATPERSYSMLTGVHQPSLTVYLPPKETATGAAVIICPGGAHRFLAIDHEGHDVARWLNSIGVAGLVLKYRLAYTEGFPYSIETSRIQRGMSGCGIGWPNCILFRAPIDAPPGVAAQSEPGSRRFYFSVPTATLVK